MIVDKIQEEKRQEIRSKQCTVNQALSSFNPNVNCNHDKSTRYVRSMQIITVYISDGGEEALVQMCIYSR